MTICDMKQGERAVVLKVECPAPVKERLRFLGIYTGAKIALLKSSFFKKTYLVEAGGTKSALGKDVAANIRVWRSV